MSPAAAADREEIRIVGSPSLVPAVEVVSKHFASNWGYPHPIVQITGTGIGFGMFCAGVGYQHPDINAATRRITAAELEACRENGVWPVTEIEFARDALVLVSRAGTGALDLTPAQLYAALAQEVEKDGGFVPNEAGRWSDVDPSLPAREIRFIGPSSRSTAMFGFVEQIMAVGCPASAALDALEEGRRHQVCRSVRRDGAFRDAPKNADGVLELLLDEPGAIGLIHFSSFLQHADDLTLHRVSGVEPDAESVGSGRYPLSQPVYVYVKNRHVDSVPGLQQLLYELTGERAISPDGYLVDVAMTPLDDIGRNRARDRALSLPAVSLPVR